MYRTLVSADTLHAHAADPEWVVFDCRFALDSPGWGLEAYRQAHIAGARYAHLDKDLAAPGRPDTGRHPLPDPDTFARWLGDQGVDSRKQVVAYDQGGGMFAARLWWMLRWQGHAAVAVLDGGWPAWEAAGYPVSDDVVRPDAAWFEPDREDGAWLTSAQLVEALDDGSVCLVDARGPERFRGDSEPIDPRAGHVPGAVNLPFAGNLGEDGTFKSPGALRRRFEPLLEKAPARDVVHMCGSGVTACHNLLAMEVAGLAGSRLYAGSWSEWITDPSRPVETGE